MIQRAIRAFWIVPLFWMYSSVQNDGCTFAIVLLSLLTQYGDVPHSGKVAASFQTMSPDERVLTVFSTSK